ncbi:hypothetical protein WKI41_05915 [Agrobacterium larrymoorei]
MMDTSLQAPNRHIHDRSAIDAMQADYSDRLRKQDWEVRSVSLDVARNLVELFHYSQGASNTATYLHGLFRKGEIFDNACFGIVWWIPPTKTAAQATFSENWEGVLSLSRMVIVPEAPKNACSFLIARSLKLIDRLRWPCLVTYADGWQGHTGSVYRASGWEHVGETKPERVYVTSYGRMVARKAGPKTRTHAEMLAAGFRCLGSFPKQKFIQKIDAILVEHGQQPFKVRASI